MSLIYDTIRILLKNCKHTLDSSTGIIFFGLRNGNFSSAAHVHYCLVTFMNFK